MIGNCDFYLPSTSFHKIKLTNNFNELPNKRGYGVVLKTNIKYIKEIITKINWHDVAFKSTNNANNLRAQLIINAINDEINIWNRGKNDNKN